jgi:hypothetical protein
VSNVTLLAAPVEAVGGFGALVVVVDVVEVVVAMLVVVVLLLLLVVVVVVVVASAAAGQTSATASAAAAARAASVDTKFPGCISTTPAHRWMGTLRGRTPGPACVVLPVGTRGAAPRLASTRAGGERCAGVAAEI